MPSIVATFSEHDDDIYDTVGYQEISGFLIFIVGTGENFQRKAMFVADGYKTNNT